MNKKTNTPNNDSPLITADRQDSTTQSVNEAILLNLATASRELPFASKAEFYEAMANPLYEKSETYRDIVDSRLALSAHLLEDSPHLVTDYRGGEDAVGMRINTESGEARLSHPGSLGDVAPAPVSRTHEPELIHTSSSVILNFSTETDGEGDGE
jgi:hypothetical protein